jgi:hypothetical protein
MIQLFALQRQPAQTQQIDGSDQTLFYGKNNDFPLRLAKLVQESPTASAAISIFADFLEGDGFSNQDISKVIVNSQGLTFGELHSLTCESYALFRGFTWLVKYNQMGEITELYPIPLENVRMKAPDAKGNISKFLVNPYYGTALYQRQDSKEYSAFTDQKSTVNQILKEGEKFKGQILYVGQTRPLSRFYPEPEYYAAKSWMAIDAGISEYHEKNLDAGFFQTVLLRKIGNPNAPSTHPADQRKNDLGELESFRTVAERLAMDMQPMMGSESLVKMIVEWGETKDTLPDIQPFPQITNEAFFNSLQETCDRKILMATKIPDILVNMGRSGSLSDGNQMSNATRVMIDRVKKPQAMLESLYAKILTRFYKPVTAEVKILAPNTFQELDAIDPLIWEVLTPEEKREWVKENTEYPVHDNVQIQVQPQAFKAVFFTDYPEGVRSEVKKAMKFLDQGGECKQTAKGIQISRDLMEGRPISFKQIRAIYSFLKRNRDKENIPFMDSCDAVKYSAWGGSAMLKYCEDKIKMMND